MTTEYKKDDKVVIIGTITHSEDEFGNLSIDLPNGDYPRHALKTNEVSHLEDFRPVEEKIKFTPEMKEEFDDLDTSVTDLISAFNQIIHVTKVYPKLHEWIINDDNAQCLFAKAWRNSSLIEVIEPEKHSITFGNGLDKQYLFKSVSENNKCVWTLSIANFNSEFTLDDVKQAEKYLGIQGLQAKWHEAAKEDSE